MTLQSFEEDCIQIMREQARGGLTRRNLIRSALAAGVPLALLPAGARMAMAQATGPEVVLVNFGGDAVEVFTRAFVEPYREIGGNIVIDGSGPSAGKILNMVQSNNVTWDIADSGIAGLAQLVPQNALEPIDYDIVDRNKLDQEFAYEYGVVNYLFSSVMAWDSSKIEGTPTMADFFDLETYPGRRMMRRDSQAMLEMTLLADGVAIEDLYPLDVDRAFAKIEPIKSELLFWNSGAESQSLLRDGEAVMGMLWNTRANILGEETNGRIKYSFVDGLLQPGLWVVPRNNPAGRQAAMEAIAFMQNPESQIVILEAMGNGPANPAAAELIDPAVRPSNPSDPENVAVQAKISADWYNEHHADTYERFLDLISS
ncbi:ABC transporter substrate-binding protein [Halodurantibacterium flavum]|uniref:ABC transporter substrate-binding protein n=1 Tax=Halodurantibacterium flavum TaxID=1382802 RepID=A0ABW4RZB3_9RHOB